MAITTALPGLWAGCVAAAALAGVSFWQQPVVETPAVAPAVSHTESIVTTLFDHHGATGHITMRLAYTLDGSVPPAIPIAAVAADRLTQGALTRTDEFTVAMNDERAFHRFILELIGSVDGYVVEGVEEAAFHPFSGGE